jgi:hypothetical protein
MAFSVISAERLTLHTPEDVARHAGELHALGGTDAVGEPGIMTRAARRHGSWESAHRAPRHHLRQAHPDGAVDASFVVGATLAVDGGYLA